MTDNQGQSEDIWEGHTTWLIHDGDKKFCASFKDMLDDSGVKRMLVTTQVALVECIC